VRIGRMQAGWTGGGGKVTEKEKGYDGNLTSSSSSSSSSSSRGATGPRRREEIYSQWGLLERTDRAADPAYLSAENNTK